MNFSYLVQIDNKVPLWPVEIHRLLQQIQNILYGASLSFFSSDYRDNLHVYSGNALLSVYVLQQHFPYNSIPTDHRYSCVVAFIKDFMPW